MKKLLLIVVLFFVGIAQAQFTGSYNVGVGETYTTLKAFCDVLNVGTVDGDITVIITSDLTEAANVALGVNTNGHSITIKPSADVDRIITFTQTTDNGASSGGFVIGLKALSTFTGNIVATNNVTIDGYADAGSTRRLYFKTNATTHYLTSPIAIVGSCSNISIKNVFVQHLGNGTAGGGAPVALMLKTYTGNLVPQNVTIDNCDVTSTAQNAGNAIGVSVSGTAPTTQGAGLIVKNCTINARHRGIFLSYLSSPVINNNTIYVNQTTSGFASIGIAGNTGNTGTINVYNNKILQLATANTAGGANGIRGIQASGGGTYNIYNNFITGFSTPATGTTELLGMRIGVTSNIYHNTIVMNNVTTTGGGGQPTAAIVNFAATCDVRNNIIITEEDDFANYCIYGAPVPSTSNYNNFYRTGTTNAKIGFATSAQATLEDWKTASSKDANSISKAITFASASDLHLNDSYKATPDFDLTGTPIGTVTTDIDGQARSGTFPYIGADEIIEQALPVELTSFSAVAKGKNIELKWNTATETNNHGFEVEKNVAGSWNNIGFVEGHGTTNAPQAYKFVDGSASGTIQYRLKQIDRSGTFTYSNAIEIAIAAAVNSYELGQNFPNPFNPTTTIRFSVQQMEHASVKVFDITGREIATLFNDVASPGQTYNVQFNAAGLASGMYFYVLQTPNAREVKKMSLLK